MNGYEIQRCDDCALFETDEDAAAAVGELLALLGRVYESSNETVADAFDVISEGAGAATTKPKDTSLGWVEQHRYRERAKAMHESEGTLEIDDSAPVSTGDPSEGAYVQAWVWVPSEESF